MKRFSTPIALLLTSFAVSGGSHAQDELPVLEGPYLGQTPSGLTAEPFAPGIVNTEEWGDAGATYLNASVAAQDKASQDLTTTTIELQFSVTRMVARDVTGDGRPDLLAVHPQEGLLSVMVSEGNKFKVAQSYETGAGMPADLAVADINLDGHLDVAVANHETSMVSVMLGDGTGGFVLNQRLETGSRPHVHAVVLAHLNNDSFPDLIVDSWENNKLLVFWGDRHRYANDPTILTVPAQPRTNLVAADLDNDGLDELITPAVSSARITIAYPDGNGTFDITSAPVSASPFFVAVANLSQDKAKNVIVAHRAGSFRNKAYDRLSILGLGQARTYEELEGSPADIDGSPSLVAAGDFTCDGVAQLVVLNQRTHDYAILQYNSGKMQQTRYSFGQAPMGVAVADFDGNGCDDIAVAWHDSKSISVQYNWP